MMSARVVGWIKRSILWIGATVLCLALIGVLLFAKFRQDLLAAHETFRIGEILAPVAVGKAIKSGEDMGTFSLDEPIVGLATQMSLDNISTRAISD
jgi:high-affinity Fe2+/Pb2+ permease